MSSIKEQLRGIMLPSRDYSVILFWEKLALQNGIFPFYKIMYLVPHTCKS